MIDVLNEIRLVLVYILIPLIFLGIIFIYFLSRKGTYKKVGIIGVISIFGIGFLILILNIGITQASTSEMYRELDYAEKTNLLVLINGKKPEFNYKDLFAEIKNKDFFTFRNHTHNTIEFEIEIVENIDTFSISLFRDSENLNKYWIYNNNHDYELEIGSVMSEILKNKK